MTTEMVKTETMEMAYSPAVIESATALQQLWEPPKRQKLSNWAEEHFVLSSEYAARSSNLHLYGWQRDMLDAFTDQSVMEVVYMTSTQMIKTLALQCALAYIVSEDPGPILLLEPKEDACMAFSKRRLAPMIRDMPCLRGKISESLHDGKSTLLSKEFPGGNLLIVSANTPTDVAQHTIRYVLCDEPDKYKASAGVEGDPMDLAWERAATFMSRRKRVMACSPTIAGQSRIGKAYADSDQRKPWVPCPTCGTMQMLKWTHVWWDKGVNHDQQAKSARYLCINTDCKSSRPEHGWSDIQRMAACEQAEWRADKPFNGIAGFWISHLYSPWKKLKEIVKHWLAVYKDPLRRKVFVNTVLAELYQEDGETPDAEKLFARREEYAFGQEVIVPQRGLFLTAAVDVQDNPPRFEYEVVAWGRNRENWSLEYGSIQVYAENGEPLPVTSVELRNVLDRDVLQRYWLHESGHYLSILVMCMDTGKRPKLVYEFARQHSQLAYNPATGLKLRTVRTVVPIKGNDDDLRIVSSVSKEDAARKRQGVRIIGIGTHCAKQEIFDLLQHVRPRPDGTLSGTPIHACYHFPKYDMRYFEGLCNEKRVVKTNGKIEYEKLGPNEPIDLKVYNRGAAAIVGIDRFTEDQWASMERDLQPIAPPPAGTDTVLDRTPGPLVDSYSGALVSPSGAGANNRQDQPSSPSSLADNPGVSHASAPPPHNVNVGPSRPPTSFSNPTPPARRLTRGKFL